MFVRAHFAHIDDSLALTDASHRDSVMLSEETRANLCLLTPKEGWIEVKGGIFHGYAFLPRYCEAKSGSLCFYKAKGAKKPERRIPLYRIKFFDCANAERPNSFMLITKSKEEFVINCPSELEMVEWENVILRQKVHVEESIDGLLYTPSE